MAPQTSSLQTYQKEFIELAIEHHVLKFGDFTLKSGRKSPYFFNTGLFYQANALKKLGEFYAQAILHAKDSLKFDLLFGPAYKGIPLATTTGIALSEKGYDYPITFNRKETKDHGEGGNLIGAPLQGCRVLVLDDVITAGTAFYESKRLIESEQATVAGVVIAMNRQETSTRSDSNALSALQEIQQNENIPIINIITLDDLITYLQERPNFLSSEMINHMLRYREQYGVKSIG